MEKKIKILTFGARWNSNTAQLGDVLRYMFNGYLPKGKEIAYYESVTEALPEFSTRFQGTHTVLLLADTSDYAHIKSLLAKALHLQLQSMPEIAKNTRNTIGDFLSGSDEMIAHCAVPPGKKIFCLGDGLYAGFAVTAGQQNLILLPHHKDRTVTLLNQQVIPYLNEFYGCRIPTDASCRYYMGKLCEELHSFNEKMGVSGTKTAVLIRNAAEKIPGFLPMLRFTPSAETRGKLPPLEYAANLSIAACELEGNPYGAAMTSAFFTGTEATAQTEKCVYLAFTDDDDTEVREVHSVNGEEIAEFLNRCTEELFKFALEKVKAMHKKVLAEDDDEASVSLFTPGKKALLAVLTVLAMAVGFAVSYFATDYVLGQQNAQNDTAITEDTQQ
ncbi:MAG: hypothetical protein IKJ63_10640 [Clostridia bacterium]|nr:hypothetical protein [Clostridia bacterium]